MKLNVDCVRDLLLTIESEIKINMEHSFLKKHIGLKEIKAMGNMDKYNEDDIYYATIILAEKGFINVRAIDADDTPPYILDYERLTAKGHEFLDDIRDLGIWEQIKTAAKDKNLGAFVNIAKQIAKEAIKKQFEDKTGVDIFKS